MILGCPNCATRFVVDPVKLGPGGRKVKCASCGHVWHATPLETAAPADAVRAPFPEEFKSEHELPPQTEQEAAPAPEADIAPAPEAQPALPIEADPPPVTEPDDSEGLTDNARLRDKIAASEEDVPLSEPTNDPARFAHEDMPRPVGHRPARRRRGLPGWLIAVIILLILAAAALGALVVLRNTLEGRIDALDPFYEQLDRLTQGSDKPPNTQTDTPPISDPNAPIAPNLQFAEISSKIEDLNGFRILLVRGKIRNIGADTETIPAARAILYDDRKNEIDTFIIEIPVDELAVGDETDFSARLSDPPIGVTALQVEFYRE